jgi:head-tail adaptor
MFRPNEAGQMTTPLQLQQPVKSVSYGVSKKTYQNTDGVVMANFKTFGGTEKNDNGIISVEETAQIVCRYRPDIKSDTRIILLPAGFDEKGKPNAVYEILGDPENIELRNMFLKCKLRRVKGGA